MPSNSPTKKPKTSKPIKCEDNEEYNECGSRCGQSCLDQAQRKTCPMRMSCVSGCFCLPGFYRNETGECVPLKKCVPPVGELITTTTPTTTRSQCRENEHYDSCGDHCFELCTPPDACGQPCGML